ncbi:hypothetical protein C8R44DRAFT_753257 [Mycena epipterygia]|nr:hypothetical protein C8R44DRAFT_753257 [Mycena epipterygia]
MPVATCTRVQMNRAHKARQWSTSDDEGRWRAHHIFGVMRGVDGGMHERRHQRARRDSGVAGNNIGAGARKSSDGTVKRPGAQPRGARVKVKGSGGAVGSDGAFKRAECQEAQPTKARATGSGGEIFQVPGEAGRWAESYSVGLKILSCPLAKP